MVDDFLCSSLFLISGRLSFMILFESQPQISWIFVITFLAHGLQIHLIELCLDGHLLVAGGAGKVVDTPGLVESSEHIRLDHLVTHIAQVAKQLMVVSLAVGQTLPLIMSVAQERFLTLGTHKMLHMPMFTQCSHHSLLNGSPACSAYWNSHFVVASQAIQLIQLLQCH